MEQGLRTFFLLSLNGLKNKIKRFLSLHRGGMSFMIIKAYKEKLKKI